MIDMLQYIDELEAIKKLVDEGKPRYLIVDKINEYIGFKKKEVDEFEKWAEIESQKDQLKVEEQMEMPFPEGYGSTQKH